MEKRGEFDVERLRFDPPRVQVRRGQEEDDAGEQGAHRLPGVASPSSSTIFVSCVKIKKLVLKKLFTCQFFYIFFAQATKIVDFPRNFLCTHKMSRRKRKFFVQIFLYFQNIFLDGGNI
jgi:hypothetical protein